jgi:hypothetical protein
VDEEASKITKIASVFCLNADVEVHCATGAAVKFG